MIGMLKYYCLILGLASSLGCSFKGFTGTNSASAQWGLPSVGADTPGTNQALTPNILAAGSNEIQQLWIQGENFNPNSRVLTLTSSGNILREYSPRELVYNLQSSPQLMTLALATNAEKLELISGLHVLVLNAPGVQSQQFALGEGRKSFNVDEFGAKPDGITDSTPAIQAAIDKLQSLRGGYELIFSEGTYKLSCENVWPSDGWTLPTASCFRIVNARGVKFRGQGATKTNFKIMNPNVGFLTVIGSEDIVVSSFSVDYDPLPFTQGRMISKNTTFGYFDLELEDGYRDLSELGGPLFPQINSNPNRIQIWGAWHFEANRPFLRENTNPLIPGLLGERVNGKTWRIFMQTDANKKTLSEFLDVGDRFAFSLRGYPTGTTFWFKQVNNLTFEHISLYAASGLATIFVQNRGNIDVNDFQLRNKLGTTRLISGNADGLHFVDNLARLIIRNSFIEGQMDDPINIHGSGYKILSMPNSQTMSFDSDKPWAYYQSDKTGSLFSVGQTVQIVNPISNRSKGLAQVKSVQTVNGITTLSLDKSIAGAEVGDALFIAEFSTPYAVINGNTFGNSRGFFRIRSPGAVFAFNKFINTFFGLNDALMISSEIDPNWVEGPLIAEHLTGMYFEGNSLMPNDWLHLVWSNVGDLTPTPQTPLPNSGFVAILTHPLVFDAGYYRLKYSDLKSLSESQLIDHWINQGIPEGRQGCESFSPQGYLANNPDYAAIFGATNYATATYQYVTQGYALGR